MFLVVVIIFIFIFYFFFFLILFMYYLYFFSYFVVFVIRLQLKTFISHISYQERKMLQNRQRMVNLELKDEGNEQLQY